MAEICGRTSSCSMKGMSGLLNLGQSCYMNATIQATRCMKDFVDIVRSGDHGEGSVHGCLYKIVETMNDSCLTIRPTTFVRMIASVDFPVNRPADAHEFFCHLLDRLHEESKTEVGMTIVSKATNMHAKREERALEAYKMMFQKGFSNVIPTFYGQLCTCLSSKQSRYERDIFETFSTLNVPVKKTLYDCLDEFFAVEELTGEDQLFDEAENRKVDASKRMYLWRNPRILVIVLNRFGEEKITDAVEIPESLDVSRYRLPPSRDNVYRLCSICNHVGDAYGGHYYTTAKWDRNWYTFDDTVIKGADGKLDGSQAYMLFYEMANKINIIV